MSHSNSHPLSLSSPPTASSSKSSGPAINNKNFSFGGDGDEEEEEEEEGGEGGNEGEAEESDLDIAFQVLDHSRILFEKALKEAKVEGDPNEILLRGYEGEELKERKIKAILAEVFNDLADAGLENGESWNSDQYLFLKICSQLEFVV